MSEQKGNMYGDAKSGVSNVFVGCHFDCLYCETSFKRQMKRKMPVINKLGKKQGCQKCYDYEPHFHEERLKQSLPLTEGDEFIWLIRSGDPAFMIKEQMNKVLDLMRLGKNEKRTFFLQSKNPAVFSLYDLPDNLIIGTTIESNIDHLVNGKTISEAPQVWNRKVLFEGVKHPRKRLTLEPILKFNRNILMRWIQDIDPEIVYIGYDSGNTTKKYKIPEPSLEKTMELIKKLEQITRVKPKLLRKAWDEV